MSAIIGYLWARVVRRFHLLLAFLALEWGRHGVVDEHRYYSNGRLKLIELRCRCGLWFYTWKNVWEKEGRR